jgi:hypothetical protein
MYARRRSTAANRAAVCSIDMPPICSKKSEVDELEEPAVPKPLKELAAAGAGAGAGTLF